MGSSNTKIMIWNMALVYLTLVVLVVLGQKQQGRILN